MLSATSYRRRAWLSCLSLLALGLATLQADPIPVVHGVGNFHEVNENIYRGAQPHGQGFQALAKIGVKTVIDLRGENSEADSVQRAGLHYIRMHWNGYKAPDDTQIAAVLALLNDSAQWPVFVHCRRGADRTGTAIACYRISHDHWSNQQALAEAKTFGMSSLEVAMQRYIMNFKGIFQTPITASNAAPAVTPVLTVAPAAQPAP
jgi:tyrosine-protein phosphatase SIW14